MSATDNEILLQVEGKVAKIILNKPKKLNALGGANYQRIGNLLREVAEMKDVTITFIMGTGRFFSAYVNCYMSAMIILSGGIL